MLPPVVAALGFLSLTAFLYLPDANCSDPVCARQRYSVFLEVDAFREFAPISFELETRDGPVSLTSVLAAGGVGVRSVVDQMDLPYDPAVGRLDRADLYQFAQTWRNRTPPADVDAQLYAVLAPGIVSDTGENLFGLMFDYESREGFAVAPREIVRAFRKHESAHIPVLQLRTFIHEMLHALNRRHLDAAQMPDGRLTVEAPTKCIANVQRSAWTLEEVPLLALSPSTVHFFQTADRTEVLPGLGNSPFELRRASARECDDARANRAPAPVSSRWEYTARRIQRLLGVSTARAQGFDTVFQEQEQEELDATLQVQAMPAAYPLGYPVTVRVIAVNSGARPLALKERLLPGFGLVRIDMREAGTEEWQSLRPLAWYEPADDDSAMLLPEERTEQTVPIYFGEDGWSFRQEGTYEIRARLHLGEEFPEIPSNVVTLSVAAPEAERDEAALQQLLDDEGELDEEAGRLIAFDGRIGAPEDLVPIERIATTFADTALGSALKLTLASHLLRPPIDTRTGTRPEPDIERALDLLDEVCTESGITALRAQLLARFGGIGGERTVAGLGAIAWDGTDPSGRPVATYADGALRPLDGQLSFGFNETQLRAAALADARRLARELRNISAARVVLVGHADAKGGCEYNDRLALERAQAVRRALIGAGIPAARIRAASLGKRRPLNFSAAEEAHALNRRVEVLYEPAEAGEGADGAHP